MKCPVCKDRNHIEVDLHSDGFADNIRECGTCGTVWGWNENTRFIVKEGLADEIQRLKAEIEDLKRELKIMKLKTMGCK